jgi:hypothetical protein
MTTEGFSESVKLIEQAGIAAYDVKWTKLSGVEVPMFEVLVTASTGVAFAYMDLRMLLGLTPPLIGRQKASELAIAALDQPGAEVASADFTIDFPGGTQATTWTVGFGAAGSTASDGSAGSVFVRVDAVTGVATVEKS